MLACEEWNDLIDLLGGSDSELSGPSSPYHSSIWYLRGRAYEALDNKDRAVVCYRRALFADCFCVEAFLRLSEGGMLSGSEEAELVSRLSFGQQDGWLQVLYACRVKRYTAVDVASMVPTGSGYHLEKSLQLATATATHHYEAHRPRRALQVTSRVLEADPYNLQCLPVHIGSLVAVQGKSELFSLAHKLAAEHPDRAISAYAIGCYYLLIGKPETARRYFNKASCLDPRLAVALVAYGHSCAACDESDHALAAYRTASRIFPGLNAPALYVGMEYLRTHSLQLADQWLRQSQKISPSDPVVYNELGVIAFENRNFPQAAQLFQQALDMMPEDKLTDLAVAPLFNLGHTMRKMGDYPAARFQYERAGAVAPLDPAIFTAIGYVCHLMGDLDQAITNYHKALGVRPADSFTGEMMARALSEQLDTPIPI